MFRVNLLKKIKLSGGGDRLKGSGSPVTASAGANKEE